MRADRHPSPAPAQEAVCTRSQIITYIDPTTGERVALAHQYERTDGSIGASGRPDPSGRMLQSNEPRKHARRPAPRLLLGSTAAGHIVRFGATLPEPTMRQLAQIIGRLPAAERHLSPAALSLLREALECDVPVTSEGGGPAYHFPERIAYPDEVVRLTDANRALVRDTYPWLHDELADWKPCFVVVQDGAAVSACFSARRGDRAAEAGVFTLADFRGRGYAGIVTAAWALAVRKLGRTPLYSTAWENVASQSVARHLGLIMFGSDFVLT